MNIKHFLFAAVFDSYLEATAFLTGNGSSMAMETGEIHPFEDS